MRKIWIIAGVLLSASIIGGAVFLAHRLRIMRQSSPGQYLQKLLEDSANKSSFTQMYGGTQNTARAVLFFFTSQTCPFCRVVHLEVIPKILEKYGNEVLIIIREHPADFYSLWAAALAWSLPALTPYLKEIFFELSPEQWAERTPQETKKYLVELALTLCRTDTEKKRMKGAVTNRALLQAIYDQKTRDNEALSITKVPIGILFVPQNQQNAKSRTIAIMDPSNATEILEMLQEIIGKPKKNSHTCARHNELNKI